MTTVDMLAMRPLRRPEILISPALHHGPARVHLLKDPDNGRSFEVGVKEYFIISRLDGVRSLDDIGQEYAHEFGARLGNAHWQRILRTLYGRQLMVITTQADSPAPAPEPPQVVVHAPGPARFDPRVDWALPGTPRPDPRSSWSAWWLALTGPRPDPRPAWSAWRPAPRGGQRDEPDPGRLSPDAPTRTPAASPASASPVSALAAPSPAAAASWRPGPRAGSAVASVRPQARPPVRGADDDRSTLFSGHTRLVSDAPALMDALHARTAFARTRPFLVVALLLITAVTVAMAVRLGALVHDTARLCHEPVTLFAVGTVLWLSLGLHELAHGAVGRAFGAHVTEIGVRWQLPATYLYCRVEDVQYLPRRRERLATVSAGVLMNLAFLLPFYPAWLLTPSHAQAHHVLGGLLLLGAAVGLFNLLPIPPLDGYKVLCHLTNTVQLATASRTFTGLLLRRAVRRGPGVGAYRRRLRVVYAGYTLCCLVLAVGFLALVGPVCRPLLPDRYADDARYLPLALVGAALVLWAVGQAGRKLRARRGRPDGRHAEGPDAAGHQAAGQQADEQPADGRRTAGNPARKAGPETAGHASPATAPRATGSGQDTPTDTPREVGMRPVESQPGPGPAAAWRPRPTPAPAHGPAPGQAPAWGQQGAAPGPGSSPAVVIDGVTKRYGEVQALAGVSLTVQRGEFFGMLGPNGAGKTTLIEIVEGMREPDSGSVTVLDQSPWPRDTALLRRMGVQTQSSAFFSRLTAREHLETVAALYGLDRSPAAHALDLVGLGDKADSRVNNLSGGQRQRLAVATALVHSPELIFLDEPTAALDPEARRALWGVLRSLKSQGRTIVYTTHHLDEAEALCDRVAIMAHGSVVALDTPNNLIRSLAAPARLMVPADRISPQHAASIPGVDRVTVNGSELVIETRAANQVLVAVGSYVGMDAIQTRTATLEDAYLQLTGSEGLS